MSEEKIVVEENSADNVKPIRKKLEIPAEEIKPDDIKPKREYKKRAPKVDASGAIDAQALGRQIQGIHILAAQITGIEEIILSEGESTELAKSVLSVCAEYDLSIDGKTGAALQLLATAAMLYIPRYFRYRSNHAAVVEHE